MVNVSTFMLTLFMMCRGKLAAMQFIGVEFRIELAFTRECIRTKLSLSKQV